MPFHNEQVFNMERILTSGFMLLIPVLLWNLVFTSKLPQAGYSADTTVARWVLVAETVLRIVVFAFPLLLTMRLESPLNKVGLALYLAGSLLYYGAWLVEIYWPESAVAANPLVIFAPYHMPLVFMAGIGLMGNSPLYIVFVVLFTLIHTYHGLLSFGYA